MTTPPDGLPSCPPPSSIVQPESTQVASAEMHLESSLIANHKWISLSLTQHKRFPRFLVPSSWCPWSTAKAMVKPYLWWHLALWHLVANYSPGDLWQGQRHQTLSSCFNQYSQQLPWIHSAILQMTEWVYSSVFSTAREQTPSLYVLPLRTLMSSGKNRVVIPLGGILKWFKIRHSFKNQRKAWPY